MCPDHHGPVPEQGDKSPSQRSGDDRYLDQEHRRAVVKVQRREVEEVDDQHQLGDPEVRPHPQQDERRLQHVVDDEVAADVGGLPDPVGVVGEEVPDVADLEDQEHEPVVGLLA